MAKRLRTFHWPVMQAAEISVCVCTFQRPALLERLLAEIEQQATGGKFTYSVIVCDNDSAQSARPVVSQFAAKSRAPITYCAEPRQNISLARNRTLEHARGNFVAFIDDDEFPGRQWLATMLSTCEREQAAGVLGPVRPHFDREPPGWIVRGKFCERPEHPTGTRMKWDESRTGNLLFRRSILDGLDPVFDPQFGTGGEDKDFFMRLTQRGHTFVWCNEAPVYETVPPSRWTRGYMLKRALLRGRNILKHPEGKLGLLAKSAAAVPLYTLILPPMLLLGQHQFMRYCVKLCDHLGRLLALAGLNPVNEREL